MAELSRGANAPLSVTSLEIAVSGARQGAVDLMVFQLGADGKVRSDADFVFFNQPSSPEGAVTLTAANHVHADLQRVPGDVEVLAVAVALDDGIAGGLNAIAGLGVEVGGGGDVHRAPALGLTVERAAVLIEIYRRQGSWKIRNVSAGWAAGLPALARELGVTIDEEPTPPVTAPAAVYPPVAAAPSGASYSPVAAAPPYPPVPGAAAPYPPPETAPSPYPAAVPSPAASVGGAAASATPPPGYAAPGGFPLPGGSLPLDPGVTPVVGPGGHPLPGGALTPSAQPAPPALVAGYPPPGGSLS